MPNHESRPDEAGIREPAAPERGPVDSPAGPALPGAWQPVTFRGVAAFSRARVGPLLVAQLAVAVAVAASIAWFLLHAWFPCILEAIHALPSTGVVENQILTTPRLTHEPLAADGFLALSVNVNDAPSLGSASDLRVEFQRAHLSICSLLGCLSVDYPAGYRFQFNQPELESWWGAWRFPIVVGVVLATIAWLFATWLVLGIVYAVPVWLTGFFQDRQLSLLGSWKLASAALLAPALTVAGSIVLYGLHAVDLLRLLLLWLAHLPLGWAYLYFALRQVPTFAAAAPRRPANPFESASPPGAAKSRPARNPFTRS